MKASARSDGLLLANARTASRDMAGDTIMPDNDDAGADGVAVGQSGSSAAAPSSRISATAMRPRSIVARCDLWFIDTLAGVDTTPIVLVSRIGEEETAKLSVFTPTFTTRGQTHIGTVHIPKTSAKFGHSTQSNTTCTGREGQVRGGLSIWTRRKKQNSRDRECRYAIPLLHVTRYMSIGTLPSKQRERVTND